jgi:serine/threonine-protein kinase
MDQLVGKKLGNYEIIELIGKGGMATVYKGHQSSMNRYVAIKVMSPQFTGETAFVQRFENEARMIAQIEHAHILPVYDFGEEGGLLYIAMRYLPTGTLEDRITEDGMPVKEAATIFNQIANALDYAHSMGIVHRDLKPANILIDAQGNAFLSDFGIAKSLEGTQNLTGTGSVVGTPTYMSPEQGLGEMIDGRSDIYALGVMLFEMLTGRVPFLAENPMAVMLKHINETPPRLNEVKPGLPEAFEEIVAKALAKNREERYQSALEMADAVERALAVVLGSTPPPRPTRQATATTKPAVGSPDASTMPSPVVGTPQQATAIPGETPGTVPGEGVISIPAPVTTLARLDQVSIKLNPLSVWLDQHAWVGNWLQAIGISLATFIMLMRVTEGAPLEVALLSLVPGVLLYGLLKAPMVGALSSMLLVLAPLLAHAPGLALIWLIMIIIAGARMSSREIMVMLLTVPFAASPFGWLIPLLGPWWLRARRVAFPAAIGTIFAMLFGLTLNWPDPGGLLPIPDVSPGELSAMRFSDFDTSYLGLFEDEQIWLAWGDIDALTGTLQATGDVLGAAFGRTGGLVLVIAAAWAVASALTVSNRRSESPVLRALGLALAYILMLSAHLIFRTPAAGDVKIGVVLLTLISAVLAYLLSQWPVQVDPAAGSTSATNLRVLRQSLGALYMAFGVAFFARELADSSMYSVLWAGGIIGTLATISSPLLGSLIVFASLIAALFPVNMTLTIIATVLLVAYFLIALLFDRRRPRRWSPLGSGLIIGGPGLAAAGLLPLGPLSLGALESQVPATLLAVGAHVLLIATIEDASALAFVAQVITSVAAMLSVERLMGSQALDNLNHKLRRLIFTGVAALLMALIYYTLGQAGENMLLTAILLSVASSAVLVAALGNRAMFWRQFIERKDDERAEEEQLDDDVSGPWQRREKKA